MDFRIYKYNEDFDYVNDPLPDDLFSFGSQFDRAKEILNNRNLVEIFHGFDSLDWMLKEGDRLLWPITKKIATEKGHAYSSRVTALKQFMCEIDIKEQSLLPNVTWAEYFALLSMAYIAESLIPRKTNNPPQPSRIDHETYSYYVDWAIESMEAICVAECLLEKQKLSDTTGMKKIGSKGGKVRASKFDGLKTKVLRLYTEKFSHIPNMSVREAARRIEEILSEEDLSILSADDKQKRFEIWIGQHLKSTT